MPTLIFNDGHFTLIGVNGPIAINLDFKGALKYLHCADKRARQILERAFVKHYPLPDISYPEELDPHQLEGVKWVLTRSRSYLAHAPGAGKTCEAIMASLFCEPRLDCCNDGTILFIVPPSLVENWRREIFYWYSKKNYGYLFMDNISAIQETAKYKVVNWEAQFLIVPDSMLTKSWVLSGLSKIKKRFIAVDEASRFKEATSQRTIALFGGRLKNGQRTPGIIHEVKHVVLLDGSPMPNRPMELWAPTFAMSPESIDFMSQEEFGFKYCGATQNDYGQWEFKHSSNEKILKEKLTNSFMHVVTEEELSHPERKRSILYMSEDVRSPKHKAWEKENLNKIDFASLTEDKSKGVLATYRKELGLAKVDWVAKYVLDRLKNTKESMLLFAWHREVLFELERLLEKHNPILVLGGTNNEYREKGFKLFQEGKRRIILGNIQAMGRGHNLQKADRILFAEWGWSDETNLQCEKRAARKGRDKNCPVRIEYIVAPNSMDEIVLRSVFRKAEITKKIIG